MNIDIERGLISKLLESKDIIPVKDRQIKYYYFSKQYRDAFKYIDKFYVKNGTLPTVRLFEQKFPNFKLDTYVKDGSETIGTEEPIHYWCDKLREKATHNKLCDGIEKVIEQIEAGETEKALSLVKSTIIHIENNLVETNAIDITQDAEERKQAYLKRKENQGMIGMSTGIDKLDLMLKGIQPKQLVTLIAKTGVGKANPLSTPILTPNGFIPMRDIKVGNLVIGQDGKPYPVVAIHPQGVKEVYELTFSDGTTSRCCKEHLWKFKTTDDRVRGNEWRVDTLENIMKLPLKRGRSYNLVIPVNDPVEFAVQECELPLDPYVLGTLLGDGGFTTDRISLSNPEEDIIYKCDTLLNEWGKFVYHKGTSCQYEFKKHEHLKENKLYRTIKHLGLQGKGSRDKFIPKQYLHANITERFALLKGLFDTDGHINEKGGYSISTFSERLKDDIVYLCRSLGYRCLINKYKDEYRIVISTDDIIFSSKKHKERYQKRQIPKKVHDYSVLKITNIKKVSEEECQCISVDSEDHTYLCDDFIVTHNTWLLILVASHMILQGYRVLFLTTEMSEEQIEDRLEAMLFGMMCGEFNYNKFKSGTLSPEQEEAYFNFLDRKSKLEKCIIETATGVSNVNAKIDQYDPDIVFIDSCYLMDDDQGSDQDWLRVAHITRDLKKLAKQRKLPIFINNQADQTTTNAKTGPELHNMSFSKAIGQDSDVVLALFRDEQMIEDHEMKLKVLKQREGTLGSVVLNWDFRTMNFKSIYSADASGRVTIEGEGRVIDDTPKNLINIEG